MLRLTLALVAALGIAGSVSATARGEPLTGRPLAELVVEGAATVGRKGVLHHLGLENGAGFDPAALDRGLRRLWASGLVDDVSVEAEEIGAGVRLVVRIVERPVVSSLGYQGLERVRQGEIDERLAADEIRVTAGEPLERGELARLEAMLEALYRERGFPLADAVAATEPAGEGRVAVVVSVDEGDRLRVDVVRFTGNTVFSDARLRQALRGSRLPAWFGVLGKPEAFDRAALARDLERIAELYRRAGYKDVAIGEPHIELAGGASRITIPVTEGERWRLGGVGFTGNRELSDSRLLELFDRPSSGWLGTRFVDEGAERVRQAYGREGFLTAEVEPVLIERDDTAAPTADVILRIDEGERYRVGRIEIAGNTATRDEVLRRELAVQEGEILDSVALGRSLRRLGQLETFELDEEEPVRFDLDPERRRVDLLLRGHEADPPRLFFGGGYGRTHGLFGEVRWASRNVRGLGHSLAASLQSGADLTRAELSYAVPWLFDRPQTLAGELFSFEESLDAGGGELLGRESRGGRLRWSRRLGLFQTFNLDYGYRDERDRRSRPTATGGTGFQEIDREVSTVTLGYTLDRVDSRLQPTRGLRLGGTLEAAGGALGGDARFLRSRLALDLFRPLAGGRRPRAVLGLHVEAGRIDPLGGSTLAFADRYLRGGDGSVRGFEPLGIFPRDAAGAALVDADGFLLGGDRYLEAALELHLPVNDLVRLVLFADAGDVWAEGQTADLSGLRRSAGLELRVTTPLFPEPLRFIWAENLSPLDGDRFKDLSFAFGVSF